MSETRIMKNRNEPQCQKIYLWTCAPSEDSDQPAHSRSLIRIFAWCIWITKDAKLLHTDNEASDQTVRMRRLIWVFVGRTCHKGQIIQMSNTKSQRSLCPFLEVHYVLPLHWMICPVVSEICFQGRQLFQTGNRKSQSEPDVTNCLPLQIAKRFKSPKWIVSCITHFQAPADKANNYRELITYLTQDCRTDLQKVRSIFVWLGCQNIDNTDYSGVTDSDSPRGYMKLIQDYRGSYSAFFTLLCR